jgi:hypothetical protein
MGECLAALLRSEDSDEAEAGAAILADAIHEIRATRKLTEVLVKIVAKVFSR